MARKATSGTGRDKATRSVVPTKYGDRYKDGSCGDALAARLKNQVTTVDDTTDTAKLVKLAKANGVWEDGYSKLNAGLIRITIGNKVRKLAREGRNIAWR